MFQLEVAHHPVCRASVRRQLAAPLGICVPLRLLFGFQDLQDLLRISHHPLRRGSPRKQRVGDKDQRVFVVGIFAQHAFGRFIGVLAVSQGPVDIKQNRVGLFPVVGPRIVLQERLQLSGALVQIRLPQDSVKTRILDARRRILGQSDSFPGFLRLGGRFRLRRQNALAHLLHARRPLVHQRFVPFSLSRTKDRVSAVQVIRLDFKDLVAILQHLVLLIGAVRDLA